MTASVDRPGLCQECSAPRQAGQRYCLECGARCGARGPLLEGVLAGLRESSEREQAALERLVAGPVGSLAQSPAASGSLAMPPPGGVSSMPNGGRSPRWFGLSLSGLRLPSAKVSAALVLMFLGFGVIIGGVAGSPGSSTLAATGRRVKLVLPAASPAAAPAKSATSPSATSPSGSGAGEPPPAEAEPTPAASTPTSSSSSSSSSSGSGPGSGSEKSGGGSSPKPASSGGKRGGGGGSSGSGGGAAKLSSVKHVFVVMLADQPYASVFGPSSTSPYLAKTLEHEGELLVRYYAIAHQGLADGIALLSGQGPTLETAANCPTYANIAPATVGADEQVAGNGCVYPSSTKTLPGQLSAKHTPWRAYVEGIGEGASAYPGGSDGPCGHPALGASDPTSGAIPPPGQSYATWRNPFVYFGSIVQAPACEADDVGLSELAGDLRAPNRTPSFAYIVPGLCHDASPTPCAPGAPAGLAGAEPFLKKVVPQITGSAAYKENGLLVITVDQAPSTGTYADSSSCCGQPQFPNLPASSSGLGPEGGGQVGALLLSPFIKGGGVSQEPYNHFSLLRTIEDIFGLPHLGYAGLPKVSSFETSIFSVSK
ncbi:MAG TPA: alkaline phosphatase family protein [Solirubrobacteraceae bacterium]|nr:alkaline phosphatase family protein [Solirubrobacteraceae bacterium]